MTTPRDFNPRLRDAEQQPLVAPVRGSLQRPDFRPKAEPPDPSAAGNEAVARAQASADRRAAAIERDQLRRAPSAEAAIAALEQRLAQSETEMITLRARIGELEAQRKAGA